MGLEPTRDCSHKILSLARLPIPTLPPTALQLLQNTARPAKSQGFFRRTLISLSLAPFPLSLLNTCQFPLFAREDPHQKTAEKNSGSIDANIPEFTGSAGNELLMDLITECI